ncbi:MAG: SPOR domain-containing protein [Myxococcota bacterium]|jgi:cell division septation protein DedD|nr:SPOR domain-containing protein [Myxococcota bacterium]
MADGSRAQKRASSPNWLASLVGAVFLVSAGFALGLVFGVVSEEPELVMGHLAGQSEEVLWSDQEAGEPPDVAARGPMLDAPEDGGAAQSGEGGDADDEMPILSAEDIASPAYAAPATPAAPAEPAVEAAPAAAPGAPTARTTASRSGYSVQVGAFAQNAAAEQVAGDLRDKGFPVYVTPSAGSADGRWRVRVGPMPTRGEAEQVAGRLKSQERLPTWVLSEGGG